jgi:hypothetical protein
MGTAMPKIKPPEFKSAKIAKAFAEFQKKIDKEKAKAAKAGKAAKPKKKKTNQMTDPVFGELKRVGSDLWERSTELRFLGKSHAVLLNVQIDDDAGLEKKQVRAFQQFSEGSSRLLREAEKSILAYYQSVCEDYGVPSVSSVAQLARLIQPEGLYFPYVRPRPTFGHLCKCTWEPEHGLAVKFVNGKVAEVGFQDIVL